MSGPQYKHSEHSGDFPPRQQQAHSFTLPIPPPPLPPNFPSAIIPSPLPPPSIPPPPIPPPLMPPPNPPFLQESFLGDSYIAPQQSSSSCAPSLAASHLPYVNCTSEEEEAFTKSSTQGFIDDWLRRVHKSRKPAKENIQIHSVTERFNNAYKLIGELENGTRTLNVMVKTVGPFEWDQKCQEIELKKKELMDILNDLKLSKQEIVLLKEKCSKRAKKRDRLRRQAERWKKQKEEEKVRRQNLNVQIDNWMTEMQEGVERVQREEELQREADAVLWGVTQKKTEARRQVALLSALLELRQVRVKRLTAEGKPVSQTQIETFNTVIERLKKMWTKHLDECLLEEQALRGMLSEAEIKEDPVKTYKKLVLQPWETAVLGSLGTLDINLKRNELIDIRRSWDQFVVQGHTPLASTIPAGWVLPVPPSSDHWRTLLKY